MSDSILYSTPAEDRASLRRHGYGECNYYRVSPVGLSTAKFIYRILRKSGIPAWKARRQIWTLIFTTHISNHKMND